MHRIQLLSAFQVLTLPPGAVSVTHDRAREIIKAILDLDELPKDNPKKQASLEAYVLHWLGLELI